MKQTSFFHCLFALALLLLPFSMIIAAERRTALVIGNAAYGDVGVLRNPVNDATDMDAALRRLGFAVTPAFGLRIPSRVGQKGVLPIAARGAT